MEYKAVQQYGKIFSLFYAKLTYSKKITFCLNISCANVHLFAYFAI